MLQQTRVGAVIPYFERWMGRFPNVSKLAAASQQEVLATWEGMGYYSRALNLHKAAQILVEEYGGKLPRDPARLRRLPGIGAYTAAAIASIAFGMDEPALDGNVRRVFARLFDIDQPIESRQAQKRLEELAAAHLPPGRTGDFNQALMDLGAMICTPKVPACQACPLNDLCLAFSSGTQSERPVKAAKSPVPHYLVAAAVIQRNGHVLVAQRPPGGLLGGLWEFPGGKAQPGEDPQSALRREIREGLGVEIGVDELLGVHRHAYTHFRVTLHAFRCSIVGGIPRNLAHDALTWADTRGLAGFPMGKIDRQIAKGLEIEDR